MPDIPAPMTMTLIAFGLPMYWSLTVSLAVFDNEPMLTAMYYVILMSLLEHVLAYSAHEDLPYFKLYQDGSFSGNNIHFSNNIGGYKEPTSSQEI
jgi:hypothetical protein